MKKWLILGLKQELHKMNLEHPVVPESHLVLKIKKQTNKQTIMGHVSKGYRSQLQDLLKTKARTI